MNTQETIKILEKKISSNMSIIETYRLPILGNDLSLQLRKSFIKENEALIYAISVLKTLNECMELKAIIDAFPTIEDIVNHMPKEWAKYKCRIIADLILYRFIKGVWEK